MYDEKLLSQRLLLSRRDLGLDQKELGRRAGVSNTYISDIERGRLTNIGIEVINALAKVLGIAPGYLAGWEENPLQGVIEETTNEEYGEEEQQLIERLRSLPAPLRRVATGLIDLLIESQVGSKPDKTE